jgi:hypothetical protein
MNETSIQELLDAPQGTVGVVTASLKASQPYSDLKGYGPTCQVELRDLTGMARCYLGLRPDGQELDAADIGKTVRVKLERYDRGEYKNVKAAGAGQYQLGDSPVPDQVIQGVPIAAPVAPACDREYLILAGNAANAASRAGLLTVDLEANTAVIVGMAMAIQSAAKVLARPVDNVSAQVQPTGPTGTPGVTNVPYAEVEKEDIPF